ncbi:MAG TPA: Glu/Leu/Phe/Val dehydrogenase dimerization domain-containing protein [Thermoanaerobaculia bacterium]|nr:Glu/Leu/Phe/Val dehydrogenase dimerization domain-containing protein [Thermoanaerobaculia bacterium]
MDLFEQMASMGHERVLFCSNPDVGLEAIIAVHSTVLGPGLGGVRMWPYASVDEALTDVLRLSRGMTYKAAAAGLNLGGGKAVIVGDPKKDKSEALLRCFGRYVDSLGGLYITAEDVGTDMDDMEQILTETRWVTGVSLAQGGGGDPSPVTAFGVLQGIKAAVAWRFGDPALAGRTVAVQGLGSVGYSLAGYLGKERARVIGADLDGEISERARAELGIAIVSPADILGVECDVLAPCALGAVIDDRTVPELRCQIVAGAANNQLADEERHGQALHDRGILYAPDFVLNAGGLINVYTELAGYDRETAMRMARGLYQNTTRIFELSRQESIPTSAAAHRVAEDRIASIQAMRPRHWARRVRTEAPAL